MPVGMWESLERFPRPVGRVEILPLDFQAFHGPSFPPALVPTDSQLPPQRDTQCAVKLVPEAVQETYRQRSIQDFEITFIQSPEPHPLVSENLADKGTLAFHPQTALL